MTIVIRTFTKHSQLCHKIHCDKFCETAAVLLLFTLLLSYTLNRDAQKACKMHSAQLRNFQWIINYTIFSCAHSSSATKRSRKSAETILCCAIIDCSHSAHRLSVSNSNSYSNVLLFNALRITGQSISRMIAFIFAIFHRWR